MEGEQNDMKEIKVMVFSGNLAELAKSEMKDVVFIPYSSSHTPARNSATRLAPPSE